MKHEGTSLDSKCRCGGLLAVLMVVWRGVQSITAGSGGAEGVTSLILPSLDVFLGQHILLTLNNILIQKYNLNHIPTPKPNLTMSNP